MFLLDDQLILSPSDLRLAAECEFALARAQDVLRGRAPRVEEEPDRMLARVAELGLHHERRELLALSAAHPGKVVQFPRPRYDRAGLIDAAQTTLDALRSGAEVVFQATFFDGGFVGHADFLELTEDGWLVCDTKLARSASVPALLQIAAYADQLVAHGIPTALYARLSLGSGQHTDHSLADLLPVYRSRRQRMEQLLKERRDHVDAAVWGDEGLLACGRCTVCEAEVEAQRDVLLVAGVRMPQRKRMLTAGVRTIEDLATREEPIKDLRQGTFERLRAQARLQVAQDSDPLGEVRSELLPGEALSVLPHPSAGDLFFDFEGDPLWSDGSDDWGLEYLFGMVEVDALADPTAVDAEAADGARFVTLWAHDRAQEKQALIDFVARVDDRLRRWPDLHIYHYAPYETTALLRLAARHGVCEDDIDRFLSQGLFVDLYSLVRGGVRVSQRSYSIKKLEPLYMPKREEDLQSGGDSIVVYHEYSAAVQVDDAATAAQRLLEIHDYNRADCLSTLLLRNWLLREATKAGLEIGVAGPVGDDLPDRQLSPQRQAALELERALRDLLDSGDGRDAVGAKSLAMTAATIQFHAREAKPFWWRHFGRLREPVTEWLGDDGVFVVESATISQPWHQATPRQRPRRVVDLIGEPLGSPLAPGAEVSAIYGSPLPDGVEMLPGHRHAKSSAGVTVLETEDLPSDHATRQRVRIEELAPKDGTHEFFPLALAPTRIIPTTKIDEALAEIGERVRAAGGDLPFEAGLDILARRRPRTRSGRGLAKVGAGDDRFIDAIAATVLDLDDSYLAVQGPPGTGKTYVGAHVIARLINDHGWKVGVCAQSHAAIENVLSAVIKAGVAADQVAKKTTETDDPPWTHLEDANELAGFIARQSGGFVIGGTAWDLANTARVERQGLDLLVIDEAGQYSLAKTLAVSVSAHNLLLLGDPQQLPQVSQGTHPEPVHTSALGWLIDDVTLDPSLGYFLETTWRMHPALTEVVSTLSYGGRLRSQEAVTTARSLAGVEPGLHVHLVDHHDNATSSPEEAVAVVDLVEQLFGRVWHDPQEGAPRPLAAADLIVITPYNAQVGLLRQHLDVHGHTDVAVGTVDKFQGREAPVAILSMAASAHSDVSRGIGFLLDRNRLNVAISRGKHAAYLVRSRVLTDFGPRTPAELTALGAFIGVCNSAVETSTQPPP